MAESIVSFPLETELMEQAKSLLDPLGMDLGTVLKFLVRQIVNEQALPLRPSIDIREQSRYLFTEMRNEAIAEHGYMTDDEINMEIQAARMEMNKRG